MEMDFEDQSWEEKCVALKRKCEEYEEMNDVLVSRTKRVHQMIQASEREKSLLVKRLEQFEVLDEVPRIDFSQMYSIPSLNNETTLLATAIRIKAELDKEVANAKTLYGKDYDNDSKKPQNIAYHSGDHGSGGVDSFRSPASSQNGVAYTPQHSPMSTSSSVTVAASNQLNSSISGSPSSGKIKKASRIKHAPHGISNLSSDKQKPLGRGHSSKKRKPDADPNAPKKPSNAFFWFCQEMRPSLQEQCREEGMSGQHDLTKALAKLWSETKTEDKKHYYHKYTADKARYDREMEEYSTNKLLSTAHDADT